jgi:predicted AAA+ superfamily ATPase
LVKSPKIHLIDSGLAAHLRGELGGDGSQAPSGALLEGFVFAELEKQISWSTVRPRLYHFRSHAGVEVDFVLEDARGRLVGVEVKSAETIGAADFTGLERLAEAVGSRFLRGVVLYRGVETIAFGERLDALPIEALWRGRA